MVDIGIQQGIRVNAINPGLIATDRFTRNVERVLHENSLHRDQALAVLLSSHGTTRVGVPGEIGCLSVICQGRFHPGRYHRSMAARLGHYR
jgi:NAD(P)-dependent dehydrogenase (short-subunit alcohol dehydrogenase family)